VIGHVVNPLALFHPTSPLLQSVPGFSAGAVNVEKQIMSTVTQAAQAYCLARQEYHQTFQDYFYKRVQLLTPSRINK
jgi:glutamine synthetase type III